MKGAAPVSVAAAITSFPTLNASTLSYFKNTLIVFRYKSNRFVVQAGEATVRRFRGPDGMTVVDINTGPVENDLTDRVVDEHGDVHGGLSF